MFGVVKGSKVLDLSCGIGRHSIYFAERGYHVVGYDPSPLFIERAKLLADECLREERKKVKFYEGIIDGFEKVLSSNNEGNFNAVIIMFNSFGYSNEIEDCRLLKQLRSVTEAGCILVIQIENRDRVCFITSGEINILYADFSSA
jgi:SAM-dependent methyltransferase